MAGGRHITAEELKLLCLCGRFGIGVVPHLRTCPACVRKVLNVLPPDRSWTPYVLDILDRRVPFGHLSKREKILLNAGQVLPESRMATHVHRCLRCHGVIAYIGLLRDMARRCGGMLMKKT